jgi:hypothetical protein
MHALLYAEEQNITQATYYTMPTPVNLFGYMVRTLPTCFKTPLKLWAHRPVKSFSENRSIPYANQHCELQSTWSTALSFSRITSCPVRKKQTGSRFFQIKSFFKIKTINNVPSKVLKKQNDEEWQRNAAYEIPAVV